MRNQITHFFEPAAIACPHFTMLVAGARTAMLRPGLSYALGSALFSEQGRKPMGREGRGQVYRVALGGEQTAILRPCRRGGLIRRFLGDAYLLSNRPLREFQVHETVHNLGLPVPQPLAVWWERHGFLIRGGLVTREVAGEPLEDYLRSRAVDPGPLLRRVGIAIRQMHEAGVFHPDLQVRNILVTEEDVHLIHFDRARLEVSLSAVMRARGLLRLRRSFEKNGFRPEAFEQVREGYGAVRIPNWLDRLYRTKARVSDRLAGRHERGTWPTVL